ncbi:hypothetical protein DITRI_Ditri18aG0070300 [Diplodiscus trichospermus]
MLSSSGLKVNFSKSHLFGIGIKDNILGLWADRISCKVDTFPSSYLGLPFSTRSNALAIWELMVKKIEKKLSSWKADRLTLRGRLTLMKTAHKKSKKIRWTDWGSIYKPKAIGNLGITYLNLKSRALLNKWVYKFGEELNSM